MINFVPNQLRGVRDSGKCYKTVGAEKSSERYVAGHDYPFSHNYTSRYNVVSPGKAPNVMATETSRITINDDETIRQDFVHFRETCTGHE